MIARFVDGMIISALVGVLLPLYFPSLFEQSEKDSTEKDVPRR